ncbi:MAG: FHA domain-containing protein [Chloroflexota bacterium]
MVASRRFTWLYCGRWWLGFFLATLFIISTSSITSAQIRNVTVELVTQADNGELTLHLRVPRGQTIDEVEVVQGDTTLDLAIEPDALPITQYILIDDGGEMVNYQAVIQSTIPRFWASGERETGVYFFDATLETLQPTDRAEQLDDFLSGYTATAGDPACLGTALDALLTQERDIDRSWRVLVITAGDLSRQTNCATETLPTSLPAPLDIIAITTEVDDALQTLVDENGGSIYTANLRGIEQRTNEVSTSWGQPTFLASGTLPDGWDADATFEMIVTLSNGTEETQTVALREYNLPQVEVVVPATTVPEEPTVALETIPPDDTATPVAVTVADPTAVPIETPTPTTAPSSNQGIAILLIVGAVLFVGGAVGLAVSLTRSRNPQPAQAPVPQNYYMELSSNTATNQQSASTSKDPTRIRERGILADNSDQTQIGDVKGDTYVMIADDEDEDDDTMLMTQVLTDDRFQKMIENSRMDDEVVGWMRIMVEGQVDIRDQPLTMRGAVIGRSQECDIQITDDRAISRKHARLDVQVDRQVTISRLSATNKVVVGGVQVGNKHVLKPNDVIHLTDTTRMVFITKESEEAQDSAENSTDDA